jgi:hypothetical protein
VFIECFAPADGPVSFDEPSGQGRVPRTVSLGRGLVNARRFVRRVLPGLMSKGACTSSAHGFPPDIGFSPAGTPLRAALPEGPPLRVAWARGDGLPDALCSALLPAAGFRVGCAEGVGVGVADGDTEVYAPGVGRLATGRRQVFGLLDVRLGQLHRPADTQRLRAFAGS